MTDAFYQPLDDDRYRSQEHTRGPWSPDHQHAGPPAALLGDALQRALGGGHVARITIEILRPVPISDLTVQAEVVRPGRSVQLADGTLSDDDGPVLLARAWSIRTQQRDLPDGPTVTEPAAPVDRATAMTFFDVPHDVGYHTAMDYRAVRGDFTEPGPALAWMRPRVPLIAGRETTPLQRVLVAADSGNGLSSVLPIDSWLFINTELTVHLTREPVGEWVSFDAATQVEANGVGLATTTIGDHQGVIGRGAQSLLIAPA